MPEDTPSANTVSTPSVATVPATQPIIINSNQDVNFGQVMSESWKIFQTYFVNIAQIVAAIHIPIYALVFFISQSLPPTTSVKGTAMSDAAKLLQNFSDATSGVGGIIVSIALIILVFKHYKHEPIPNFVGLLQETVNKHFLKYLGTTLVLVICLIPLLLCLLAPAVIFGIFWIFTPYLVVSSDLTFFSAMSASKKMVTNHWWSVFGFCIVTMVIAWVVSFAAVIPTAILNSSNLGIFTIFSQLLLNLVSAYFTVCYATYFVKFKETYGIKIEATKLPQVAAAPQS